MRAICIGECMIELRPAGTGLLARGFAGDAYNTAVYLKRSAPVIDVQFLTATGEDSLSAAMRAAWAAEGIGADLAFVEPGREPGLYLIERDEAGDRRFHYWRSASAARCWFERLMHAGGAERLAGADLIFLSGISLAILLGPERRAASDLIAGLRGRVGLIAFDLNIRQALWPNLDAVRGALAPMIGQADIVRASRDDAAILFGAGPPQDHIAAFRALGAREIVLTLDAEGCLVASGDALVALPSPPVAQVVDTSGAGDCFNGAYLAARLSGAEPEAAARAALLAASRKVGYSGAIVPACVPVSITSAKDA